MENTGSAIDVSVIIVARHEGLASYKTILNLRQAYQLLDDRNITYETIVCMPDSDSRVRELFSGLHDDVDFQVLRPATESVGGGINRAIREARGKYVCVQRASDMVIDTWLLRALQFLDSQSDDEFMVVHPEVYIEFGTDVWKNLVWWLPDSADISDEFPALIDRNLWPGVVCAARKLFGAVPFPEKSSADSYESYYFNAESLSRGIRHYCVPQTLGFHRIIDEQDYFTHYRLDCVLPHVSLWPQLERLESLATGQKHLVITREQSKPVKHSPISRLGKAMMRRLHWRTNPVKAVCSEERNVSVNLPEWLIMQWKAINVIDNHVWPTRDMLRNVEMHSYGCTVEERRMFMAFRTLIGQSTRTPDMLFFTYDPLGDGGTERVLANYLHALQRLHPEWHIAVMRKAPSHTTMFPGDVDFIDFFDAVDGLDDWQRMTVLDRWVAWTGVRRFFFFFAGWALGDFAYRWARRHVSYLKANDCAVYVALFMNETVSPDEKGRILNLADPFLREIDEAVSKVFSDNQTIIRQALSLNAFAPDKFVVHYQPVGMIPCVEPATIDVKRPLRVLWASRFATQKRPDLVRAIGKRLEFDSDDSIRIVMYGREQNVDPAIVEDCEYVEYGGSYSGFKSLPLERFDVLLYTADNDGLPNVLLEAAAHGLPIVASDEGAVREFVINGLTGILVPTEDIDGYIQALRWMHTHPRETREFVLRSQHLLKTRHSFERFEEQVGRDIV